MMRSVKWLAIVVLLLTSGACIKIEQAEDDSSGMGAGNQGPGTQPYAEDVSCQSSVDCAEGELCLDGVCQMERCGEPYSSLAPMGKNHYFGTDGEFAIISDDVYIDGYEAEDGAYLNSWNLTDTTSNIVDVAGGDLLGERPHAVAVATEFSDEVQIKHGDDVFSMNIAIWPTALAAGDVDADGMDELVAFAEDGTISVCHVDTRECTAATIPGAKGKDVTVADVDGDGFAEPAFLFEIDDKSEIVVWNTDTEKTGDEETKGWEFSFPVRAISSGRFAEESAAELVILEDRGWWGFANDRVHVFSAASGELTVSKDVNGQTVDVAVGDRDSDDLAEIAILRDDHKFELFKRTESGIDSIDTWNISVGQAAKRISMLDWNNDSASGRLVAGPELLAGEAVPMVVLNFPPYPHKVAKAALSASVTLGSSESTSESMSDTVSLNLGMMVSFGAETPIFKAKIGAYVNKDYSVTQTFTKTMSVGARYWVLAQPDMHGTDYAVVVLSCGCFHRYSYVTEDPGFRIGGSGQTVDLYVPVGGQTTLWSTKRYNAMVEAVGGGLPIIEPTTRVGDLSSYPSQLQTMAGNPIPEEDMLFPETPSYNVSDVGFVSFWLVAGESETNAVAEKTSLGVKGSVGAGGVTVDATIGVGYTQGYSVQIGKSTTFMGGVPPIPDDPSTPEDEYKVHQYAFTPAVYREHYTDAAGEDAGYYVLTYAVND